ncbi:MAG: hypothetical protein IPK62_00680 [Bacteroidetes bacterium]|nr:hypothetical protein [Bacteroidota bacterium]
MKKLLLCLLLFPTITYAQYYYSFKDISGKWVELTRTDKNSDVTPFKDTLYIEIREDGFMMVRHTIGATYYGDAELHENKLSIQKDVYSVEGNEDGVLKLKKGKFTHRFIKQEAFNPSPVPKTIPGAESGVILTDYENLSGKWTVYKKTDPKFTHGTFYIKNMEIIEMNMNNVFSAEINFHNMDSVYSAYATIKIQDKELQIVSTDKVLKTRMVKNDGEEMILEHGSTTYFLKRFKK